ncbi:MAG: hypothetical protein ACTSPB_02085 [Candidatus Thorarchaeota archaeon]
MVLVKGRKYDAIEFAGGVRIDENSDGKLQVRYGDVTIVFDISSDGNIPSA